MQLKFKNYSSKDILRKIKRQATDCNVWKTYTYLTKDLYSKYMNNSYKSITIKNNLIKIEQQF